MRKVIFLLQDVWKKLVHDKFISVVMLFTMMVGFFHPLMAINDVNDLISDKKLSAYPNVSQLSVIDVYMNYAEEKELAVTINRCKEDGVLSEAGYYAIARQIVYSESDSYSMYVNGIMPEYLTMSGYELMAGEMFSQTDYEQEELVCLLSHGGILEQKGTQVGDSVHILGQSFKVKGIIRAPKIHGSILIPYTTAKMVLSGGQIQYQALVYSDSKLSPKILSSKIFPDSSLISAQTGEEHEQIYSESVRDINGRRMMRAVIVIIFTIFSLIMLLTGKTIQEKYGIAVRLAMGADKGLVRLQAVLENLIIMSAAFLLDILMYGRVAGMLNGANVYLQPATILQMFVGGLILTVMSSMISFAYCIRKNSMQMLLGKQV